MKKVFFAMLIALGGCASVPKNFTPHYADSDVGLASKISMDGYYVTQHGCDSTFFSLFMFYPNGLFTIATASEISQELIKCFEKGGKSTICKYPLWGTYQLLGDTIKTQTIRTEGGGCVIFRDYFVTSDKELINISDYIEPQYTQMAYMKNYPSFRENKCSMSAKFFYLKNKRSIQDCPFVNQKWFKKETVFE